MALFSFALFVEKLEVDFVMWHVQHALEAVRWILIAVGTLRNFFENEIAVTKMSITNWHTSSMVFCLAKFLKSFKQVLAQN